MRAVLRACSTVFTAGLIMALPVGTAFADETGRIDNVSTKGSTVNVLYSLPGVPDGVSPDLGTATVTLNGQQFDATAKPASDSTNTVKRTVVLAIDVSDSMKGAAFTAAQDAATAYIDRAPKDVYIGIVTFADKVETVQAPTQDKAALNNAVAGLSLTRTTHLYDGLLQALNLAGTEGQRSILLLSDGQDTTSTPLSTVVAEANGSEVRIDAIALGQKLTADSPLQQVADATHGTVTATSSLSELKALFTSQATDLAQQLVISFRAPTAASSGTLQVSIDAGGQTLTDGTFVSLAAGKAASTKPTYTKSKSSLPSISRPVLIGGVGLLFLGLAVLLGFGMTRLTPAAATPMQQQLSLYTVHGMKRSDRSKRGGEQGAQQLKDSAVAMADRIMEQRDFEESLTQKLERAGINLKASEWLLVHAGIFIGGALVSVMLTNGNWFFMVIVAFAGLVGPWMYLSVKESRRIKAFQTGLAPTLQIIAGALQAGLSLPQAIDTVVQEGSEPVASEFRRAIIEQRLGVEIEDSLESVADRMDSLDFKWVVMAIRIQREVGGNLAELLLTVAATLREREYLRRQVSVLSAEGRLSAFILGGLPPFFVAYLALARPTYLAPMIHTPIGWGMIATACVLMTVGVIWLKQAVKVVV